MILTNKLIKEQSKILLKRSRKQKKIVIKKIKHIIKPFLINYGMSVKNLELKNPILIPKIMNYHPNSTLNYFSINEESEFLTISHIVENGIYSNFVIVDFYDLSLEILEIILFQLNLIYYKDKD